VTKMRRKKVNLMKNDEKLKVYRWVVIEVLETHGESLKREGTKVRRKKKGWLS